METRGKYVENNNRIFEAVYKGKPYARTLVVDLDVLRWTMEDFAKSLATFLDSEGTPTRKAMKEFLWNVRFQLKDIHPDLVKDVVVAIDQTIGPDIDDDKDDS